MGASLQPFKWTRNRERAARILAEGGTEHEAATAANVARSTIQRWKMNLDFEMEVDKLTLLVGVARRAERIRIATRAVKQRVQDDGAFIVTDRDILDWLKYLQSETDGAKFDLNAIVENFATSVYGDDSDKGEETESRDNEG